MLGMTSCGDFPRENEVYAVYRYTVQLHYLDGGSKERSFLTVFEPYISAGYRGGFPRFYWRPMGEWTEVYENGVCRYEVLYKKDVTEEYYGHKIISTRRCIDRMVTPVYNRIVHKLDMGDKEKGGTK